MFRPWTTLALVLPLAGCFYFDRINSAPDAKIMGPSTGFQGDMLMFTSSGGDPDGEGLTYAWSAYRCPTMNQCLQPIATSSATSIMVPVTTKDFVIVNLRVTDHDGAFDEAQHVVTILNRAPAIDTLYVEGLQNNLGGYTLGRVLSVRAAWHDDDVDDTVTPQWTTYPAPMSAPGYDALEEISPTEQAFTPDAIGSWTIELRISDGEPDGSDLAELMIRIDADRDPCLGPLAPMMAGAEAPILVERDFGPRSFSVATVIDDLDPYPYEIGTTDDILGRPEFRWLLQRPGGSLDVVPGSDLAAYDLQPEAFAPGDELTLRLEVRDRKHIGTSTWPACPVDAATCASAFDDPGCSQRATWKVRIQ